MKKTMILGAVLVTAMGIASAGVAAAPKAVRATELTAKVWSDLEHGVVQELVIEFRQGDRLPASLQVEGDLIETTEANSSYLVVKRPFWVKLEQNQVLMSLDGNAFKPFNQVVSGSFTAGASFEQPGGGIANAINVLFKAHLK